MCTSVDSDGWTSCGRYGRSFRSAPTRGGRFFPLSSFIDDLEALAVKSGHPPFSLSLSFAFV